MRTRVVNINRGDDYEVYVGRGSKWGNPFERRSVKSRTESIEKYEEHLRSSPELMAALPELKGKTIGCFCTPAACHADVLARMADELG